MNDNGYPDQPGEVIVKPMNYGDVHGHYCHFTCPRRPGHRCGVPLKPGRRTRTNGWDWDGNVEAPTLSPSIHCRSPEETPGSGGCGWHGFIRAGKLEGA